jgi:hypothetical protein
MYHSLNRNTTYQSVFLLSSRNERYGRKCLYGLLLLFTLWSPEYEESVLGMPPPLSLSVCLCAPRKRRILFIFGIEDLIRHRALPDECEHICSRNRGSSDGWISWQRLWRFILRVSNMWVQFPSSTYDGMGGTFRNMNGTSTGAQAKNAGSRSLVAGFLPAPWFKFHFICSLC